MNLRDVNYLTIGDFYGKIYLAKLKKLEKTNNDEKFKNTMK